MNSSCRIVGNHTFCWALEKSNSFLQCNLKDFPTVGNRQRNPNLFTKITPELLLNVVYVNVQKPNEWSNLLLISSQIRFTAYMSNFTQKTLYIHLKVYFSIINHGLSLYQCEPQHIYCITDNNNNSCGILAVFSFQILFNVLACLTAVAE